MSASSLPIISLEDAAGVLAEGGIVAVPTETVYGLAADALNDAAVARIYEAKGRPRFNPLICHVDTIEMAKSYVVVTPLAEALMTHFWPGPLTLVLPLRPESKVSPLVTAGLETLAVRMPANPQTRAVIGRLGHPVAAPSANPSGKISPTSAQDVIRHMSGRIDGIIDGGDCSVGLESTIICLDGDSVILLRPGAITKADITSACGKPVTDYDGTSITAPGQLTSHYAPNQSVRLEANAPMNNEFFIGFGPGPADMTLSKTSDLREAAANLFRALHRANESGRPIAVAPIPDKGIGIAINDRLRRAAAPRDGTP